METDPDFAKAYNNRGIARMAIGDVQGAMKDFRQAIALSPKQTQAYANICFVWLHQGNSREAEQSFKQSVATDPSSRILIEERVAEITQR